MSADWRDEDAIYELGPIVLRCRNRRRDRSWVALGGSPLTLHLMLPMAALFLTFPLVGIALWKEVPPPLIKDPFWGSLIVVWYVGSCFGVYRYQFTAPAADVLFLHEKGLRYRRRLIPFDHLTRIRPGMDEPRFVESLNRLTGAAGRRRITVFPEDRFAERARLASVTLEFKDARPLALRSLLVRQEADDLDRFFSTIAARHPELIAPEDLAAIRGVIASQAF